MNVTHCNPLMPARIPCTEHQFYNTRFRLELTKYKYIDIPVSLCDDCNTLKISDRHVKIAVYELQRAVESIIAKETNGISVICRIKRKVNDVCERIIFGNPDNSYVPRPKPW